MIKKNIKENEFSPAPGGTNGTVNYGTPYGTHTSPLVSQNPVNFQSSDNNKAVNQNSNTRKNAINPSDIENGIEAVYSKTNVPDPDSVEAGLRYVNGRQIKKDPNQARIEVIQNLMNNPNYYSDLNQLNINDDEMVKAMGKDMKKDPTTVRESRHPNDAPARGKISTNPEETKKIFAEMANNRNNKYAVNSQISDVMKELIEAKNQRSAWKTE